MSDPLPGWREGNAKRRIIDFVESVTREGAATFVPPADRIAVFDNDGTLWSEKPAYFQLMYAIDEVRANAADHPEWAVIPGVQAAAAGDLATLIDLGESGIVQILAVTHANMTTDAFAASVEKWIADAEHPTLGLRYQECTFAPMVQLLDHLRASGFKVFIIPGGGIEFMRVFAEETYGVPREFVMGSHLAVEYRYIDGVPALFRGSEIGFIDDGPGKPVGIHHRIGRRPILAFGNSDGDFEMLEYTTAGDGPRLGLLLHHDDGEREFAYDRESHVGRLDRGLDEAEHRDWVVVSMRDDFAVVFSEGQGSDRPV